MDLLTSDFPATFVRVFAFVFGAAWGSFFNVAIYRWPRDMSVVKPPSHCPSCGSAIRWYHNVPIFGFLFLRGRTACCGTRMDPRYVVVEILGGALAFAVAELVFVRAHPATSFIFGAMEFSAYFVFVGGLLIASFVDLEHTIIPDEVSLPGAAVGLLTAAWRLDPGAQEALVGAGVGFLFVQVFLVWTYEALLGRRGMGEGDAKLMLMIGAFLGWKGVFFSLTAGSVQGIVAAVFSLRRSGRSESSLVRPPAGPLLAANVDAHPSPEGPSEPIELDETSDESTSILRAKMPFGPFLALGALEFFFFGEQVETFIVNWMTGGPIE